VRETLVIFRRELKSLFLSPIAYVFGVLFLLVQLTVTILLGTLTDGVQASMQVFFRVLPWVLLIFVPALTMRLWAEERKLGTIELLMTFPVRAHHPVLGKFAASVAFLAFVLVLTVGLPLTLGVYGGVDWPAVLAMYAASVLFACSYVAVGMFFSSLTKDQVVAMLLSVVTLAVLFLLGWPVLIEYVVEWMPAWAVDALNGISPFKYFQSIARGVVDTRDVVYFACFCGFFLYANALVLKARRQQG
jgi:ABC-2 type transport system permease protein